MTCSGRSECLSATGPCVSTYDRVSVETGFTLRMNLLMHIMGNTTSFGLSPFVSFPDPSLASSASIPAQNQQSLQQPR